MKKLTFILIGAGNRGKCYTQHAYMHGGYELVGIADPNEQTREFMREHYHIPKENCYKTYDELLARGKIADFAMICTQDRLHFAPAMKAIEQGYPLMLEKPVAPTPEECIQIRNAAEQKGVPVVVCHVLRYTPFARAVKQVIAEGHLGRIINIIHTECVGNIHYSHSLFVALGATQRNPPTCCWQNHATTWIFCSGFCRANAKRYSHLDA